MVFGSHQLLQGGPLPQDLADYSFHKSSSGLLPIVCFFPHFEYGGGLASFWLSRKGQVYMICCNLLAILLLGGYRVFC